MIRDGFSVAEDIAGFEAVVWEHVLEGWALDDFPRRDAFAEMLRRAEFEFSND